MNRPVMRIVKHDQYGGFEELSVRESARPEPAADQVRVRIVAVGLHVGDCFGVRGAPLPMRFVSGFFGPKVGIPGFDFAGVVDAVGDEVEGYAVGDEVFGTNEHAGAAAEFICVRPRDLARKHPELSFEAAAVLPTSGLAALHALRDVAKLQAGQRVLINGASGGVGHFAVQLAKHYGAHVTGVCSTRNLEMVRSLGADEVVDYTREDFTTAGKRYDLIFDNVENRELADIRRALEPSGMLIVNSGTGAEGFAMFVRMVKPLLLSPFVSQDLKRYLSMPNPDDLQLLGDLAARGELKPVLDRGFALEDTADALRYIEQGHVSGKVYLSIAR